MNLHQRSHLYFYICIILTTICMSSSFPTGKYLISIEHVPPMLLGGWHFTIAGFIILLVLFLKRALNMYYHQLIIIVIKALYLSLPSDYYKRRNNGIVKYSNVIGCILFNVCRFTVYQSIMVSCSCAFYTERAFNND